MLSVCEGGTCTYLQQIPGRRKRHHFGPRQFAQFVAQAIQPVGRNPSIEYCLSERLLTYRPKWSLLLGLLSLHLAQLVRDPASRQWR
jgi:hypothetical protein